MRGEGASDHRRQHHQSVPSSLNSEAPTVSNAGGATVRKAHKHGEKDKEAVLPQGLMTAICVKYATVPGPRMSALRRRF